jgi:regulator of RNase E activity RraA
MSLTEELSAMPLPGLSSNALSDVLDAEGIWGVLSTRIRRLSGDDRVLFGRAYTVQWRPARKGFDMRASMSTWEEVRGFLAPDVQDGRGMVYVAGAGEVLEHMALAGGLSATHFENIGFEGIVLGGAIRDAHVLQRRRIPVFGTRLVPSDTAGAYVVTEVGTECVVDNVVVHSGDYVFADDSGIVAFPSARAEQILARALEVVADEDAVMQRLERGEDLNAILSSGGRI